MFKKKYILFFLALSSGCKTKSAGIEKDSLLFSKFPQEINVTFKKFIKTGNGIPGRLYLSDSTIIVKGMPTANEDDFYYFYQYALNTKTLIGKYFKEGRKFGQSLAPISSGVIARKFWIHDFTLNKISIVDLSVRRAPADSSGIKEFPLTHFYSSVQLVDNNTFIGCGAEHSTFKIQEVELPSSKEISEYGEFLDVPDGYPFFAWKMGYASFIFYSENHDKAALAYRFADRVEIYDRKTHKSITIKGPEGYDAEFEAAKVGSADISIRTDKSRLAFLSAGTVTSDYLYLLYSGKNHEAVNAPYGQCIYVYDWNGKPVKKINLDRPISGFTVSADNKILYGSDPASGYILKGVL